MSSFRILSGAQGRHGLAATLFAVAVLFAALVAPELSAAQGRQGGKVTMLWSSDVDSLDPGITYVTYGQMLSNATQRTLLAYRPEDVDQAIPDLAASLPEVSADGLTVTVRLKAGIRFSPPVNRDVTSRDVKYAIERGFFASVATPYAQLYFADIVGARVGVPAGTTIRGIETPDDLTVVFRLARPRAGTLIAAMTMALTAPVPAEYASPFDRRRRSNYGTHQVATGPYMIRNDARGNLVGYRPGRRIDVVRNPNWVAATDFRPARVDAIDIRQGKTNQTRASRRILRGRRLLNGDFPAPVGELSSELRRRRDQFAFVSAGAINMIALNTRLAPFTNVDVRRAVVAGFNRALVLREAGGPLNGQVATHYIPPGVRRFADAGGVAGPGLDFVSDRNGSRARAPRYLRRAGYAGGRFTGRTRIELLISNDTLGRLAGRITRSQLVRLGFRVRLRAVPFERMLQRCGNPRARIHICPSFGWIRDFPDAQSVLDPLFNGRNILSRGNNNLSQLNVPAINNAFEAAKQLTDPTARAQAWGDIDRQLVALAPAVPLTWPRTANIRSSDVIAEPSVALATWDMSFIALR
jgi:peptide/nickel transport system substrate-binding protein